ncbi:MAG: holo-ACP synthase [Anaerolineae bacterium]|nr:holo-ACP synthase [Anaerolineae bacterium]
MLRIGVDMIEIDRVQRAMERHGERFFARFFTASEREQANNIPARLAARFAAKEATSKALGTGIGDVRWTDIEVWSDERRRPHLRLHNTAAELAADLKLNEWQVSLSHTDTHAIAFVVAMYRPEAAD